MRKVKKTVSVKKQFKLHARIHFSNDRIYNIWIIPDIFCRNKSCRLYVKKSSQDTKDEANNNENRVYLIDFISISLKFQVKTKIHSPRLRIIHTVGRIAFRVHTIYRRRSKSQQIIATYIET